MSRENSVDLTGIVDSHPELKILRGHGHMPVVDFDLVVEQQRIPCSAFRDMATTVSRTVRKGQIVSLRGSLYTYPIAGKNGSCVRLAVRVDNIAVGEGEKKPSVYDIV